MSNRLICCLLLDESGSMLASKSDALEGINAYIRTLRGDYEAKPELGEVYISLITFSGRELGRFGNNDVRFLHNLTPIVEVSPITDADYNPDGSTPLLRAITTVIESLKKLTHKPQLDKDFKDFEAFLDGKPVNVEPDDKVVVVIQTDGEETEYGSTYTKDSVSKLIAEQEALGNWSFVFLGAGIDAVEDGMALGMRAGSALSFTGTANAWDSYTNVYTSAATTTVNLRNSNATSNTCFATSIQNELQKHDPTANNLEGEPTTKKS